MEEKLIEIYKEKILEKISVYKYNPAFAGFAFLAIDVKNKYSNKAYTEAHSAISCHGSLMGTFSSLMGVYKGTGLACASIYGGYYPEALEFWKFITSYKSPWRDLFKEPWETFNDPNDNMAGYVVPKKVLNTPDLIPLCYNFMIMARQTMETPGIIKTWYQLVTKFNYNPARAIPLSRFFNYDNGRFTKTCYSIDGSHYPLSDRDAYDYNSAGNFNPAAFEKGEYRKLDSVSLSSSIWKYEKKPKVKKNFIVKGKKVSVPTRFSTLCYVDIDDTIIAFDKQLDERIQENA